METLKSLPVNNFDIGLAVIWCIVALYNYKAFVMNLTLVSYLLIQAITSTNFQAFILISACYFYAAQINIKFLSAFRKAFICFGAVYFLGAIDQALYYHFEFDTYFDRIQPYLVTIVNAYVLALLIGGGGEQDAGLANNNTSAFNRWFARLSLHKESDQNLPNGKTK